MLISLGKSLLGRKGFTGSQNITQKNTDYKREKNVPLQWKQTPPLKPTDLTLHASWCDKIKTHIAYAIFLVKYLNLHIGKQTISSL